MMPDNLENYEEEKIYVKGDHQEDEYSDYEENMEEVVVDTKEPTEPTTNAQEYQLIKSKENYQMLIPVTSITKMDIQINLVRKALQVLIKPKVRSQKGLFNQTVVLPKVVNRKAVKMGYRKGQLVITVDLL